MRNSFLFFLLLLSSLTVEAQFSTLEQRLYELPDVLFKAIDAPDGFEAAYELHIKQPIDHENPEKGHFYQRAYLSHRSFKAPMVLATEGYMRPSNRMYELTGYLDANQVDVEHRYFGTSSPDSLDYTYLNLKQVTADLHHIRTLLGQLYGRMPKRYPRCANARVKKPGGIAAPAPLARQRRRYGIHLSKPGRSFRIRGFGIPFFFLAVGA